MKRELLMLMDKRENAIKMAHLLLPRHTSQCLSLQKSSFLADVPAEIDTFAFIDNDFNTVL